MNVYGALGQSAPDATVLSPVYAVPDAKHATVRVLACNRDAATTIRIAHASGNQPDAIAQYIVYDFPLDANATKSTATVTMGASDVIRCYSDSGNVSFTVTGIEADD